MEDAAALMYPLGAKKQKRLMSAKVN